jgi:capsular exopolysaccharide synthesis family protein
MESTLPVTPRLEPGELLRVVLRRKWLLLLPWTVAIIAGVSAAFLLKPIYFSSVTLQFERPQQLSGNLGGIGGGAQSADQQASLMRGQVQSSLFLRNVLIASGLKNDPATRTWALQHVSRYPGLAKEDAIEAFLIDYLRDAVSIKAARGDFLQIVVGDYTPERARKFAEAMANQFVVSSKASQLEAVRATQEFSVEQQQVYKRKLEESESRLEAARRSALGSMGGSSVSPTNLPQARALLDQTDGEIEDQRQKVRTLRGQLSGKARENDPTTLGSPEVTSLLGQLSGLERQLGLAMVSGSNDASIRIQLARKSAELEEQLGTNAVRALPSLPSDTHDLLVRYRMAQAAVQGSESRRAAIAGQVGAFQSQVYSAPNRELEVARVQQEVDNNRALYNSFLQQSASAQIAEAFENAKISGRFLVIDPANRPLSPGKPNRLMLILLSFIAGGIIGVGAVLVAEQHDQSMKNAEDVENLLGLPVLGAIPRVDELERSRRRSKSAPATVPGVPGPREHGLLHRLKVESPLGLEFRRVFLKLARTRGRALPHTLMVTSATRGEGKTTTSASLGITMARELKEKVLLVDFDLRSPSLHRALGLPSSSWGLAQMLAQRNFDERFIRSTVLPNLDFLAAGKSERPAAELVDLTTVEWFLNEAASRYSLVLIDAPPNLAVPDPLILGRAVEGVLYVIKAGSTVRKAAEYGVKVQREARDNVLGVLLNDIGEILPHYYGYRYNAYGYSDEVAGGES